jgi:hypothetical protein
LGGLILDSKGNLDFMALLPKCKRIIYRIDPKEVNCDGIGHSGFFSKKLCGGSDGLWNRSLDWVLNGTENGMDGLKRTEFPQGSGFEWVDSLKAKL